MKETKKLLDSEHQGFKTLMVKNTVAEALSVLRDTLGVKESMGRGQVVEYLLRYYIEKEGKR